MCVCGLCFCARIQSDEIIQYMLQTGIFLIKENKHIHWSNSKYHAYHMQQENYHVDHQQNHDPRCNLFWQYSKVVILNVPPRCKSVLKTYEICYNDYVTLSFFCRRIEDTPLPLKYKNGSLLYPDDKLNNGNLCLTNFSRGNPLQLE